MVRLGGSATHGSLRPPATTIATRGWIDLIPLQSLVPRSNQRAVPGDANREPVRTDLGLACSCARQVPARAPIFRCVFEGTTTDFELGMPTPLRSGLRSTGLNPTRPGRRSKALRPTASKTSLDATDTSEHRQPERRTRDAAGDPRVESSVVLVRTLLWGHTYSSVSDAFAPNPYAGWRLRSFFNARALAVPQRVLRPITRHLRARYPPQVHLLDTIGRVLHLLDTADTTVSALGHLLLRTRHRTLALRAHYGSIGLPNNPAVAVEGSVHLFTPHPHLAATASAIDGNAAPPGASSA